MTVEQWDWFLNNLWGILKPMLYILPYFTCMWLGWTAKSKYYNREFRNHLGEHALDIMHRVEMDLHTKDVKIDNQAIENKQLKVENSMLRHKAELIKGVE